MNTSRDKWSKYWNYSIFFFASKNGTVPFQTYRKLSMLSDSLSVFLRHFQVIWKYAVAGWIFEIPIITPTIEIYYQISFSLFLMFIEALKLQNGHFRWRYVFSQRIFKCSKKKIAPLSRWNVLPVFRVFLNFFLLSQMPPGPWSSLCCWAGQVQHQNGGLAPKLPQRRLQNCLPKVDPFDNFDESLNIFILFKPSNTDSHFKRLHLKPGLTDNSRHLFFSLIAAGTCLQLWRWNIRAALGPDFVLMF